jgi:F-type H+-transporting ATPase subunit b
MKRRAFLATLALSAVLPLVAQQTESEAERVKESTGVTERGPAIFWGWLNFLMLAGGLGYVVKKNAVPYFAQRSREIRKGMIEAEELRTTADAKVAEVERRMANLAAQIEALHAEALREEEAEAARLLEQTGLERAKIQAQMEEEIAAAGKAVQIELRRHTAEIALDLARNKIVARMSPEVEDRLVRGFVTRLEQPAVEVQSI